VLNSLSGSKMGDVVDICHGLERGMVAPTIDVDFSNVCFKVDKDVQSLARHLANGPLLVSALSQFVMLKSDQHASKPQTNA